ncbi:MAG: GAF domain-containing protein [Verrucomicrobia bacterium]|nr:GAF domain-containing protein [Verrucomicrobiota bacterium]
MESEERIAEVITLRRILRAQARVVTAVQELSLVRSLPAIQEVVRRAARDIAGADGATFILRDGNKCHYADEDAISPLWKGQRFPMETCISGWVMLNAKPATIPDIYADPRIPADAYRPTFVKSLTMVPIRLHQPIGAIGCYWARPYTATPEEVVLLQALAHTTSVAMENVQVFTELEQRVAQRTTQLEALNREMEAFSYSVSHDLRAPLRAISGFAELLEGEIGPAVSAKGRRYLEAMQQGATQMGSLIADLLKMAQAARQELRRTEVDLAEIAREVAARLREDQPERAVELIIPERLPVSGDRTLLLVVLDNLLSNAWKYTGKTAQPRIELGWENGPPGESNFFVRDNGVGFELAKADKLFTPFTRLHTAYEFPGTGVGLSTVQRIIHRHGGRIWATAEVGRGATFHFTCDGAEPAG